MAELSKALSEFTETATLPIGSLLMASVEDAQSETGYETFAVKSETMAGVFARQYTYAQLMTDAKSLVGSVNELVAGKQKAFVDIEGTLTAGQTNITLSDEAILSTSTVDIYTDVYGISPSAVSVADGSVTITFEAQASNLGVKARIS